VDRTLRPLPYNHPTGVSTRRRGCFGGVAAYIRPLLPGPSVSANFGRPTAASFAHAIVPPQGLGGLVGDSLRRLERFDGARPRTRLALAYRESGEVIGAELKDLGGDVSVPARKDLRLGRHSRVGTVTKPSARTKCVEGSRMAGFGYGRDP
jgi:hypothetical protein